MRKAIAGVATVGLVFKLFWFLYSLWFEEYQHDSKQLNSKL
jgi:hypothetical protein